GQRRCLLSLSHLHRGGPGRLAAPRAAHRPATTVAALDQRLVVAGAPARSGGVVAARSGHHFQPAAIGRLAIAHRERPGCRVSGRVGLRRGISAPNGGRLRSRHWPGRIAAVTQGGFAMPEYLAPGVYVEEVSFRPKSIEGVSTSVAGFIGPTRFGPVGGEPELLT